MESCEYLLDVSSSATRRSALRFLLSNPTETQIGYGLCWLRAAKLGEHQASEAVRGTLALAASYPAAEIVFDYAEPPENLSPPAHAAFELRRQQVAQIGEPWITTFDPPTLHEMLQDLGFDRCMTMIAAICFHAIAVVTSASRHPNPAHMSFMLNANNAPGGHLAA